MAIAGSSTKKANMSTQPEALRLADTTPSLRGGDWGDNAAAELRRLHALNAELAEALQWLVDLMPDPELDNDAVQREQVVKAKTIIAKAEGREA